MRRTFAWTAVILCLGLLISSAASYPSAEKGFEPPDVSDFSGQPWGQAFEKLHEKISREYAFTQWKKIDWQALHDRFKPRVTQAESGSNAKAYYMALREYVFSLPDGHVNLKGDDRGAKFGLVGGGFGIIAARLDNGRIIAARVMPGSPAAKAGIRTGAEVLTWGGKPAKQALKETSTLFSEVPAATDDAKVYEQLRFMFRSNVGASRGITYKNTGEAAKSATITAVDDKYATLTFTRTFGDIENIRKAKMIHSKLLPGNIGYIKVLAEVDIKGQPPTAQQFRDAVRSFNNYGVKGLIVDLRGNLGGADAMSADILGIFYAKKTHYEYQNWYNANSGRMEILLPDASGESFIGGKALYIEPRSPRFKGPVVALVDNGCISSGDGLAYGIRKYSKGKVVGFRGTSASFGMMLAPYMVLMPEGFEISYPVGQSLGKNKRVQLDSRGGKGGVTPTHRIPMTIENAVNWAAGKDVELEYALKLF